MGTDTQGKILGDPAGQGEAEGSQEWGRQSMKPLPSTEGFWEVWPLPPTRTELSADSTPASECTSKNADFSREAQTPGLPLLLCNSKEKQGWNSKKAQLR